MSASYGPEYVGGDIDRRVERDWLVLDGWWNPELFCSQWRLLRIGAAKLLVVFDAEGSWLVLRE